MIYKRGKTYWYNFRWTIKNADCSNASFRIVKSAKTQNRNDAKDAEDEHRRALRLGQIHPSDPWPKPTATAPPVFRSFAKEFLQYANMHTKPGTRTFYEGSLGRLLAYAAIADTPLNAITGDLSGRYARYRQEVAGKLYRYSQRRSTNFAESSQARCGMGQIEPYGCNPRTSSA